MKINFAYFDLNKLLEEMKLIFDSRIRNKGLELSLKRKNVPSQIKLDESRLKQILVNLLGNAVKFTKTGNIKLNINFIDKSAIGKGNLEITVIDTGIGISEEKQEEIFEAFIQQDGQSTREYGGTGLGLAITKKLTGLMGGSIGLQSKKGQGSIFNLKFEEVEYKTNIKTLEKEYTFKEINFKPATIMIVDDVKSNRDLLKIKLEKKGFNILEAENGEQALDIFGKYNIDLILMDLKMPVMDGYQASEKIWAKINNDEKINDIPIIALTAAATETEKKKAESSGFTNFVTKPINENELMKLLSMYLPCQVKREENANREVIKKREKINQDIKIKNINLDFELAVENRKEVIKHLKEEFLPRVEYFEEVLIISEVERFIADLREFASSYQIKFLVDYCDNFKKHLNNFDLDKIEGKLVDFIKMAHKNCNS